MDNSTILKCACEKVELKVHGEPIISADCLCIDCQKAEKELRKLVLSQTIIDQYGATPFCLYRKDRIEFIAGKEELNEFHLNQDSKTRRVIATCCNAPIFLEFSDGHWLSIYKSLWKEIPPKAELRTMTKQKPEGVELPNDIPNPKTHTLKFYGKLLWAWMEMGFKTPKVTFVKGSINV